MRYGDVGKIRAQREPEYDKHSISEFHNDVDVRRCAPIELIPRRAAISERSGFEEPKTTEK